MSVSTDIRDFVLRPFYNPPFLKRPLAVLVTVSNICTLYFIFVFI